MCRRTVAPGRAGSLAPGRAGSTPESAIGDHPPTGRFVPVVATLAICVCWAVWCMPARAESGSVHFSSAAGTDITVDTRWVDGAGYRPVRVTVTPSVPTATDKTFTVEFLLRRRQRPEESYDLRVARDIELPAGSRGVRATVSLPRYPDCDEYAINVLEDGKLIQGLRTPWTRFANMPTDWGECLPALLLVGETMPDTSQVAALLPLENYAGSQMVSNYNRTPFPPPNVAPQMPNVPQALPNVISRNATELPQRWIDYSSLDIVCLSLGHLQELAGKNPLALKAILQWTAAGGNLWVYAVGEDWQRVGELESLLGLPPGTGDAGGPADRRWNRPEKEVYLRRVQGALSEIDAAERRYSGTISRVFESDGIIYSDEPTYQGIVQPPIGEAPSGPHFLLRRYEMGQIVALAAEDPFPGTADEWRGVLNAVGPDRWLWHRRHGVSMVSQNADYWNFLIPGVGLVPVLEFCVLITLFVLGIGPANYWLLRRSGRLHLLVVTIPLGAVTVTLIMFAYALVADGLGTRVRVRSVTQLDQKQGQAVCWARLSYYAGLAPRRGLSFPDDLTVLPLEYLPVPSRYEGPLRRGLIWDQGQRGEEQWYNSGWLNSRTPMQLLTVRSRQSRLGLELLPSSGNPARLRVKNRLGTRIEQLLIRADEGNWYWAEGVDADRTVELGPFTSRAQTELRQTDLENDPRMSVVERTGYDSNSDIFGLRYERRSRGGNSAITMPKQQTSRLEVSLADLRAQVAANPPLLEPGSYVAIVRESPEVVLGISSASEESSYHVILGRW